MWNSLDKFANFVYLLAITIPIALAVFGATALVLLIIGQLHTGYVLLGGLSLSAIAIMPLVLFINKKRPYETSKERAVFTTLAFVFACTWVGFNLNFNSEHIFINRDPGIYVVTAKFLQNEPNINIDKIETLSEKDGYFSSAAGFDTSTLDSSELFAQGAHLLPTLLGLGSRFIGDAAIFNGNILFAGFALMAFFAFAINIVGPRLALLAQVTLGLILPFIYFARDTYSEILAMTFVFGALSLLYVAMSKSGRSHALWLLAGLVLGAGAMTRIDAFLTIAAVIVFVCSYLLMQTKKTDRKLSLKNVAFLSMGTSITTLIGLMDIRILSSGYFMSEWRYVSLELALIATLLVASYFAVRWGWTKNNAIRLDNMTKNWRVIAISAAFITFWFIMATRFLWMSDIKTRSEMTVLFYGVYIGPLLVVLGVIGIVMMIRLASMTKKSAYLFLPFLTVAISTMLLYVTRHTISPDQVWASRRALPIILPALILAGFFFVYQVSKKVQKKGGQTGGKTRVGSALVVILVLSPLAITHRFATLSSFEQSSAITSVCDKLPTNTTLVWLGRAAMDAPLATRAFCNEESVGYRGEGDELTRERLALAYNKASAYNKTLLIGVYGGQRDDFLRSATLTHAGEKVTDNIELTYRKPPVNIHTSKSDIYIGMVTRDGNVIPIDSN